jgi:hypothetical protein
MEAVDLTGAQRLEVVVAYRSRNQRLVLTAFAPGELLEACFSAGRLYGSVAGSSELCEVAVEAVFPPGTVHPERPSRALVKRWER